MLDFGTERVRRTDVNVDFVDDLGVVAHVDELAEQVEVGVDLSDVVRAGVITMFSEALFKVGLVQRLTYLSVRFVDRGVVGSAAVTYRIFEIGADEEAMTFELVGNELWVDGRRHRTFVGEKRVERFHDLDGITREVRDENFVAKTGPEVRGGAAQVGKLACVRNVSEASPQVSDVCVSVGVVGIGVWGGSSSIVGSGVFGIGT